VKTYIQARGFELTQALESFVLDRVEPILQDHPEGVCYLGVRLSDINGPRGGADKCCRVHIAVPQQRDLFVQDIQPNMYDAIDNAIRRAARSLRRKLARRRDRRQRATTALQRQPLAPCGAAAI